MPRRHRLTGRDSGTCRLLLVVSATLTICCPACERAPSGTPSSAPAPASDESPRETIEQLIEARASGLYQRIGELVVAPHGSEVVKTLIAVDEFLGANDTLCKYVRDEFAFGLSRSIDHSHWAGRLGVFSRYVELVDQQVEGRSAMVSFTVDGRVPLQRAKLVWAGGEWRYDPGPGYDPQLPAAFHEMARGLRQVLDDLKSGRLEADRIRADPEQLVEEVRVRLLPGVKMLPMPTTQPGAEEHD